MGEDAGAAAEPNDGGPELAPPDEEAVPERRVASPACATGAGMTGGPPIATAGVSRAVGAPASFEGEDCPAPVGVDVAGLLSSPHVQFHIQFQPERVDAVGAVRHAPVQFQTHVQVSGAPEPADESAVSVDPPPPGEVEVSGAAAVTPPGALAPAVLAVTPGALAPLVLAVTPGALTPSVETSTPGALTLVRVGEPAGRVLSWDEPEAGACAGDSAAAGASAGDAFAAGAGFEGADEVPVLDSPPPAAAAPAVFVCVTAPSSPGLSTRTATLTFAGPP